MSMTMVKQNVGGLFTYKPYLCGAGERIFEVTTTEEPEYGHVCEAATEDSAKAIVAALNSAAETVRQHIKRYEQKSAPVVEDKPQDRPESLGSWGSCIPGKNQD